jgi:uncharacterized Fe-S cluster-containing protein
MTQSTNVELPQLDCGLCGFKSCAELSAQLRADPGLIKRCVHLLEQRAAARPQDASACGTCASACSALFAVADEVSWQDSLGRDFDFYLEHFPEDPGPREIIIPHNPMITRELDVQVGDSLIGRPLGMSCGCPITHCGIAIDVDKRTGVIVWCVTGPLTPRQKGYKDLGYYIAEGYEGMVKKARGDLKIGMRYFFQPRMCMLQWRHSGLVNYLNRTPEGWQVRLEGLWIG